MTKVLEAPRKEQRISVLVVDDESSILQVVKDMLSEQRYEILLADSLTDAAEIIRDKEISIVLTDLILGEDSGVDVMQQVQKHQPDAKVILMTGKPTIQNAISVIKSGAFDYLVKPFEMEDLLRSVRIAEDQLKLERENISLKQMMSFYKISEAMGSVIELDKLLNLILDTAITEFSADFAALHLGSDGNQLRLQKFVCKVPELSDGLTHFSQNLGQEVYSENRPIILDQQEASARFDLSSIKSAICQPLMSKGKIIGTLCLVRQTDIKRFTPGQLTTLSLFAAKAALSIENSKLYTELEDAYFDTVEALANAIEARDQYTAGHTERVWEITQSIARTLGWDEQRIKELRMGAVLHDVGKIGVPDSILNKRGQLSAEEQEIMQTHPDLGARIVRQIEFLKPALPYILFHHERYDGKGYPTGLRGEAIPIQGRLLAVVDTFDAITSDRPYRKGQGVDEAVAEIKRNCGTQFDPDIIKAFLITINAEVEKPA